MVHSSPLTMNASSCHTEIRGFWSHSLSNLLNPDFVNHKNVIPRPHADVSALNSWRGEQMSEADPRCHLDSARPAGGGREGAPASRAGGRVRHPARGTVAS